MQFKFSVANNLFFCSEKKKLLWKRRLRVFHGESSFLQQTDDVLCVQRVHFFAIPRTVAHSTSVWSGLPCPSPGDFPDPGIKRGSPALQADLFLMSEPLSCRENPNSLPHFMRTCLLLQSSLTSPTSLPGLLLLEVRFLIWNFFSHVFNRA